MEDDGPPSAAPAAYHPHLLRCQPQVPIPAVGTAVFALRPEVDAHNRLVFLPLNAPQYFRDAASLAERLWDSPTAKAAVEEAGSDIRKVRAALRDTVATTEQLRYQAERFGATDARKALSELRLKGPVFLGIMVPDNLTPSARAWWAHTGVLQVTTCVKGVVTVAYMTEVGGPAAFDVFRPLSVAAWHLDRNLLERYTGTRGQYALGVVLSAGVDSVTLHIDVSRDFNTPEPPPGPEPS